MYNPKSTIAEEFIDNEEVLASLEFAKNNKNNVQLIEKILDKAKLGKGLTHKSGKLLSHGGFSAAHKAAQCNLHQKLSSKNLFVFSTKSRSSACEKSTLFHIFWA